MSYFKQVAIFFSVLLTVSQLGCDRTNSNSELENQFSILKTAGAEFASELASVNDITTAESSLPKLQDSYERMFRAGRALKPLEESSSRSAAITIKEIRDFRAKQKKELNEEQRRIGQLSDEIQELLKPVLIRIQAHVD